MAGVHIMYVYMICSEFVYFDTAVDPLPMQLMFARHKTELSHLCLHYWLVVSDRMNVVDDKQYLCFCHESNCSSMLLSVQQRIKCLCVTCVSAEVVCHWLSNFLHVSTMFVCLLCVCESSVCMWNFFSPFSLQNCLKHFG